jgi:hypothetical protein
MEICLLVDRLCFGSSSLICFVLLSKFCTNVFACTYSCKGRVYVWLLAFPASGAAFTQDEQGTPPGTGADLLQLAINSSSSGMASNAAAVAVKFPAAQSPDVVRKLLLTAASRGHTAAVLRLASCKLVQPHLDACTVECVLAQLIERDDRRGFKLISKLPVATQLGSAAVARLLQAALQQGRPGWVVSLLALPATADFSAAVVAQLLHALLLSRSAYSCTAAAQLCLLQAAQQLSGSALEELLLAAIERNGDSKRETCMQALCGLPAAAQLRSTSAARLLLAAVKQDSRGCEYWLYRLPGLQQIDSAALEMLLEAAVQKDRSGVAEKLMELSAAAQLSLDAVVLLLTTALTCGRSHWMHQLLTQPMAQHLSADMVAQLLQTAVAHHSDVGSIAWLCKLPAADSISTTVLVQLLEAAVVKSASWGAISMDVLLKLPAAQQLRCDEVARLLQQVITHGSHTTSVYRLPAAQQLSSQQLLQLLQAAVTYSSGWFLKRACELPGAKQGVLQKHGRA